MKIEKIQIADRFREDLGDVSDLAASIAVHGLMHPVVVTLDGRLIAGHRRIEAAKSLGWTEIKVTFIDGVVDAADLLRMERDENTCRKDMTPSEKIALGRALEELERPKAKARMSEAGKSSAPGRPADESPVRANEPLCSRPAPIGDVREIVAPAVGMSTATYTRAKQLVTAAESGDGEAMAQVIEMDRTGKVTPAYEKWKGQPVNRGAEAPVRRNAFGVDAPTPKKKSAVKNHKGRKPETAMEGAIATLSGLTLPMQSLTEADLADVSDEVRTRWVKELTTAMSTLRRVRDLIKEIS